MTDARTRTVEGHVFVLGGSLNCPHPELCDVSPSGIKSPTEGPEYEAYVHRHAQEHGLGTFATLVDAERNLGVWCFYFFHKFVYGNPELAPFPHWELHAFVAYSEWSETDLMSRIPLSKRKNKSYLPPVGARRTGEYRRFKQVEVPRQCQKTSVGSRAYVIFRSLHEYFINGRVNFRILLRSAVSTLTRQSLAVIRRMARSSQKIARLYGVWLFKCGKCGHAAQLVEKVQSCHGKVYRGGEEQVCGSTTSLVQKRLSLMNTSYGAGSSGADTLSFRWLTDGPDADAVAAYNCFATGLDTENTGQRPDLYIWDDPQTDKNSNTVEKRAAICGKFDESWRQLQFGGEMLVFDTRKYMNDFASMIQREPLSAMFHALRREVRWRTDEPENPPFVVDGWRYYFPVKGDGQRALDAKEVAELKKQKNFSAEYMNDPLDEESAKFKRSDFIIVSRSNDPSQWPDGQRAAVPIEVRFGLGCEVSSAEQMELDAARVRINAMNACDPAGDGKQKKTGDDNFISALRIDRHGRLYVTKLAAGHWGSKRLYDEIEKASTYNRAAFTDYEMPASETHIKEAFEKWVRDKSEELTAIYGTPTMVRPPMRWSHMPKSTKDSRIDQMESYLPIYILEDAADDALIEKYIAQWVGRSVEDHDDGPDSTSRLIPYFATRRYKAPAEEEQPTWVDPDDGAAYVPLGAIKNMMQKPPVGLWGAQGAGQVNRG